MNVTYPKLAAALNATGRQVQFTCSWPVYQALSPQCNSNLQLPGCFPMDEIVSACSSWRVFKGAHAIAAPRDHYCAVVDVALLFLLPLLLLLGLLPFLLMILCPSPLSPPQRFLLVDVGYCCCCCACIQSPCSNGQWPIEPHSKPPPPIRRTYGPLCAVILLTH